jgi:YVTN family beta-propeller protein
MLRNSSRSNSRMNVLRPLAGLLLAGLGLAGVASAQSVPFPTYTAGPQTNGTFVVSDGTIITPAGTQVNLGITTRAKAIALNPNSATHTAAVLQMGAPQSVTIFNTQTGAVLQTYSPPYTNSKGGTSYDSDGSQDGITYTADGLHLLFSQDGYNSAYKSGNAYVTIANVDPLSGLITSTGGANPLPVQVSVPIDAISGVLTNVTCSPYNPPAVYGSKPPVNAGSPPGTTGSIEIPCGQTVSILSDNTFTSYPLGIAIAPNGQTAYAVLNNNDTLTQISLTGLTTTPPTAPVQGAEVRVGNVPHDVIISPDGTTAYVSNEAGRIATSSDFQGYSNGTPVVAAYPTGSTATGTVSVVNLATFTVTGSISTGMHPTAMAFWGKNLLVVNTYDDTISVIDTNINQVVRTIALGLPGLGVGPNSIAVDSVHNIAYVALYNANSVAVVDLNNPFIPVLGLIPVAYAPSSVVLDSADGVLLVANDKGWGTTGNPNPFQTAPNTVAPQTYNSLGTEFGAKGLNTHQDLGTVSIVPVPSLPALWAMTQQVFQNNHWDLLQNILSAGGGNRWATPVAIPKHIGDPSLIKHVFVIIRENRTYDQILGDVVGGNGDASLASFGDGQIYAPYSITPNAHALVQRFPLFDNYYNPSRQSADGHNWITQAMAPYSDDIQSPDWLRDYPSNGGEALAYQNKGHLWDTAAAAGVKMKNYGEYIEYDTFNVPGCTTAVVPSNNCEPTWTQFYNDVLGYENQINGQTQLVYQNATVSHTPLPNLANVTVTNYPQFDLNIPDQFRFDIWNQDFQNDVANGTVPQLEFMWISSDHTGGPPVSYAMQADNDLALGRFVDAISHSSIWPSSVIFVTEDDAQTGVDHVDGHRSPGYVFSPYVKQVNPNGTGPSVIEDSTFYTQVNFTRTIEQILGISPMNQNDLVASPMSEIFIDNPPATNFLPWTHVQNDVPLCLDVPGYTDPNGNSCATSTLMANASPKAKALQAAWLKKKAEIFAGKYHTPDSEDPDTVNHMIWYEATGFKVPFPGEKTVRPPSDFKNVARPKTEEDDD